MAPRAGLEAFVKLFADDTQLKQQFGALRVQAEKAGIDMSKAFQGGTARGGAAGGLGGGGILERGGLGQISRAAGLGGSGRGGGGGGWGAPGPRAIAIPAAVIGALKLYTDGVKAAMDAERELMKARQSGDLGAVTTIFQKSSDAVNDYDANVLAATDTTVGFEAATRRVIAGAAIAWAELSGRGINQLTKEAEAAKQAATQMWQVFGSGKLAIDTLKRSSEELAANAQISIKAAENTMEYTAAIDQLIRSKDRAAEADKRSIAQEIARLRLDLVNSKITEAEFTDRLADAKERLSAVDTKTSRERTQIEQDRRRQLGEMAAAETEHVAKLGAARRQQRDAVVTALGQIVEAESQATVSLEQAFRARTEIQQEQSRSAIAALEEETAARRSAIQSRLEGAVGQDRVKLERELTQVTADESTKRTQIIGQAIGQSLQLAQRERQERIAQAEHIFSIQRTLNQRRLQDDLATQAAIARAAQHGSQVQIAALQQVAAIQAQLQSQARSTISQSISILQQQSQRLGLEGPAFVSLGSIQRGVEQQRARDARTREQLQAGRSVRTEEAQSALGNQPFFDQFKQFGDDINRAATSAFTPIAEQFKALVGDGITGELAGLTTKLSESFAGLVTAATPALGNLEKLFSDTWDRIIAKAEQGTSLLGQSITRMVEDNLTRALRDAERRS